MSKQDYTTIFTVDQSPELPVVIDAFTVSRMMVCLIY